MDVGETNFRFTLDDPEKNSRAIRYPQSAELHVSSLDRLSSKPGTSQTLVQLGSDLSSTPGSYNYSAAQCVIQTKRALLYGYFNRIALTEMQIFVRLPTIITGVNDVFYLTVAPAGINPVTYPVTIPPGYYTTTLLAVAMTTAIKATCSNLTNAAVFSVAAPTISGTIPASGPIITGFTLATANTDTIVFAAPTTGVTLAVQYAYWKFYRLIGCTQTSLVGYPGFIPTPVIVTGAPNWLPTDYIDIVSKKLTNYKDTKDTNSNEQATLGVIGRVYLTDALRLGQSTAGFSDPNVTGAAPFTFVKKWANPNWSQWSPNQSIDSIDITLLDMWGDVLYWSNVNGSQSTEWEMTFVASE